MLAVISSRRYCSIAVYIRMLNISSSIVHHSQCRRHLALHLFGIGVGDELHQVVLLALAVLDKVFDTFLEAVECGLVVVLVDFEAGAGEGACEVVMECGTVVVALLDVECECAVELAVHNPLVVASREDQFAVEVAGVVPLAFSSVDVYAEVVAVQREAGARGGALAVGSLVG